MVTSGDTKNALLIYNLAAGTAVDAESWLGRVVQRLCLRMGYQLSVYPTQPNMKGCELLPSAPPHPDLILIAGGDGTIRLMLGALCDVRSDVPVGIIPVGTGNQLARNLGIYEPGLLTDAVDEALDVVEHGSPSRIDLGKMNGEYFCVAAGAGPLSDAIASPSPHDKATLKMLAYVGSVMQTLAAPPVVFRLAIGRDEFNVAASGIFVTNVSDLGMGTLSHTAQLNDGLLDLCILSPEEFVDYLELGFRFAGGLVGGPPPYYVRKIRQVDIQVLPVTSPLSGLQAFAHNIRSALAGATDAPPTYVEVSASVDGDLCGTTPMHIEVVPNAVNVMIPRPRSRPAG